MSCRDKELLLASSGPGGLLNILEGTGQPPTAKGYLAPGVEVEKPWVGGPR